MEPWSPGGEFPALGASWVEPAHGGGVAHRDRVHRPLGADGEGALSRSVGAELDSGAGVPPVLHPAVLGGKMERHLLETFLGESGLPTVADLAQSVAVAAAMVCQDAPTNLGNNLNTDRPKVD